MDDFKQEIITKVRTAMYFQKYKTNLEENISNLAIEEIFDDPFEIRMFIYELPKEFYRFPEKFKVSLKEIGEAVLNE